MQNYQGNYYNSYGGNRPPLEYHTDTIRRRALRGIYSKTAAALIASEILTYIFVFAFAAFLKAAGYEDIKDADGLSVMTAGAVMMYFLSVTFGLITSSLIFGSAYHLNAAELFSAEKVTVKKLCLTALICIGAANLVYVVNILSMAGIQAAGYEMKQSISEVSTPTGQFGDIVTTVLLAPVFEEIFYRGIIFRNLCRADRRSAIFISAAIFGLIHGNPFQFLLGFIVGVVFAFADLYMDSIIPSIIGHMAVNSHQYINELFTGDYSFFFRCILMAAFILIGLSAFVYAAGKYKLTFPEKHNRKILPALITSVPCWIFFIYTFSRMFTVFERVSL